MKFIVEKFESELRNANPKLININYGLNDIFNYIDDYKEFNILCFDQSWGGYSPYGKQIIKNKIVQYLNYTTHMCSVF